MVLWSHGAGALEPDRAITQYVHQSWQTDDGLPQNSVRAIAQTADGYLWLGTEEGLVRFDGIRFTVFNKRNTPAFLHNFVHSLLVSSDNTLWIGTKGGGVVSLKDGAFRTFTTTDGLASTYVKSLAEAPDGAIWAGHFGGGVSLLNHGSIHAVGAGPGALRGLFVLALAADRDSVWVGSDGGGVDQLRAGRWTNHMLSTQHGQNIAAALFRDRDSSLWIGGTGMLFHLHDGILDRHPLPGGQANGLVRTLCRDRNGNLWVGTDAAGVFRYRNGSFVHYGAADGLTNNVVAVIFEDREGSLWIGTDGGGLNRLKDGKVLAFTPREGIAEDSVRAVGGDSTGAIYVGTYNSGLNKIQNGITTVFTTKDGLSSNQIRSIYSDRKGRLWVGTFAHGLNLMENGRFARYPLSKEDSFIVAILEDRSGTLWVGSRNGLIRIRDGQTRKFRVEDGLTSDLIRFLYEDSRGRLWVGTDVGLNLIEGEQIRRFTTKDGLSNNFVYAAHEDRDLALWFATDGGGLSRLYNGQFTSFGTRDGLFDDTLFSILEDDQGNLWMSSNNGIFRVNRRELVDHTRVAAHSTVYGTADGMRSRECNGGFQYGGYQGPDGRMWFATIAGVVLVDPGRMQNSSISPPVRIEETVADRKLIDLSRNANVDPGTQNIEFRYTALSLLSPERARFRYRLFGFDKDWIDAGTRRTAYYTNLAPGAYRFGVAAANEDGAFTSDGASVAFNMRPYFWQTRTFAAVSSGSAIFLLLILFRLRVRHLRERQKELVALVAAKTRDLQSSVAALESKERLIHADLLRAHAFQQGILPKLPASPAWKFAAIYRPVELVGGDIYDLCDLKPGQFRTFIADATGHGVQASLRTVGLKTEYDRIKTTFADPADLLVELNHRLVLAYPNLEMHCTACCFDLEVDVAGQAQLRYANAAHRPLLHRSNGQVVEIYQPGPYLAMTDRIELASTVYPIRPGDRLLAFTDGISEQENGSREQFGLDRMGAFLNTGCALDEVLQLLVDAVNQFAQGPLSDDVTIIAFERNGGS